MALANIGGDTPYAYKLGPDGNIVINEAATPGDVGPVVSVPGAAPPNTTDVPATPQSIAAWYQNWLATDPTLQAVLGGINATGSAYKGALSNEEAQLLEQYGLIPSGASQYASFIDPTVAGIAQQATAGGVSTVAQLARAYAQQQTSTLDNLAARGMLRSGATGVRENNDLTNYDQQSYDALQKLLQGLQGNYSTYLGQSDQLNQQISSANSDAMTRLTDLINAGAVTAPTTTTAPVTSPAATTTAAPGPTTSPALPPQPPAAPLPPSSPATPVGKAPAPIDT